jgi:hypothetical protein
MKAYNKSYTPHSLYLLENCDQAKLKPNQSIPSWLHDGVQCFPTESVKLLIRMTYYWIHVPHFVYAHLRRGTIKNGLDFDHCLILPCATQYLRTIPFQNSNCWVEE